MYLAFCVVKIKGYAAVFLTLLIFVYHVVFLKDFDQVICVFFAHVFYPEIIDDEAEADWLPDMCP